MLRVLFVEILFIPVCTAVKQLCAFRVYKWSWHAEICIFVCLCNKYYCDTFPSRFTSLSSVRSQNASFSLSALAHNTHFKRSAAEMRKMQNALALTAARELFLGGLLSLFVCCSCICPKKFSVRTLTNGSCSCDCFDRERECLRFKKGRESFSRDDTEWVNYYI